MQTLPANVVATITPHHLALTIDQAVSTPLAFCKPVAKYPSDRAALRSIIAAGHPQFFLGSDSAPHPSGNKLPTMTLSVTKSGEELTLPSPCAAGIYTSPHLLPLVATIFETAGIPLTRMEGFVSKFGRDFYGYPAPAGEVVTLQRKAWTVPTAYGYDKAAGGREHVIPFMAEEQMGWEII